MSKRKRIGGGQRTPNVQLAVQQQFRSAPLPTPRELAEYEQVVPGLAGTLVRMAEENQKDRLRTNRTMRTAIILGQVFAFSVSLGALAAGAYLAYKGQNVAGVATIVTALGIPLTAFFYRRRNSKS